MDAGYKTRQGEAIVNYLKLHSNEHVTIDEILNELRNVGEQIGKTTIYRQVEKLTALGEVRKYKIEGGISACYQYVADGEVYENHFHLKCTKCGKLFHISCDYMDEIDSHIKEYHGFVIDNTQTVFYGTCKACSTLENRKTL